MEKIKLVAVSGSVRLARPSSARPGTALGLWTKKSFVSQILPVEH